MADTIRTVRERGIGMGSGSKDPAGGEERLLALRESFPIVRSTRYLVSHSLGAMPESMADAMQEFTALWRDRGVRAWADAWWMMSLEVGDLVAPFLGADAGSIVMLPNVTTAEAVVLSAFDYSGTRNRVLLIEGEFPSVRYVHGGLARGLGAEVRTVQPWVEGRFDERRLLEAIDERTALVPLSHVLFETSTMIEVEPIARRCAEVGATLILDVFQSAGIVPIDLKRWGVPVAVGGVLKWLCGGPGGGFLYVDPGLRGRLEPKLTGWMAHENPFSFEAPPMRYRDDALRFGLGTPAVPALYAAREGLRAVSAAAPDGMGAIRAKSTRQTAKLIGAADSRGFEVRTPRDAERRGGSVSVLVPHAREVAAELNARDVLCDYRPNSGIRLSPHFYTSDDDLDAAFAATDEILATGAWKRHVSAETLVT